MRVSKLVGAAALLVLAGAAVPGSLTAQAKKPSVMGHTAEGRTACLTCHGAATDSTKAVPADHDGRPNESCMLCHAKDAAVQTKDSPSYRHTAQGRSNCLMCHNGKTKAPVAPEASHPGMTDSKFCGYCHQHAAP